MKSFARTWGSLSIILTIALGLTACGGSSSSDGGEQKAPEKTINWNAPNGVTGSVRNALNTESLDGVSVQVYDSADFERGGQLPVAFTMQPLRSTVTDENGQFSIESFGVEGYPVFRYFLENYIDTVLYYTAPAPEVDDSSSLQLEPARLPTADEVNGTPNIAGKITNALTGRAIEGATVKLFRDGNTSLAANYTLTTDANGMYEQEEVAAGVYAAVISAENYITTTRNTLYAYVGATSEYDEQNQNLNFTITPVLEEGVWRIVLTWGEHPRDLDSHMWAPSDGQTAENCSESASGWEYDKHIFYGHKSDGGYMSEDSTLNLDVDDTSSYGPETITITDQQDGIYYYSIHHYSGQKSIAESGAKIEVYNGSDLKRVFYAPTTGGEGKYVWEVFNLDGNTITSVNKYQVHRTGGSGPACPRVM